MRREFRNNNQGLMDLINYAALVEQGVCLLKDGSLLAAFSYRGQDLDSSSIETLEFLSAHVNQTLCQLGDGWMLHTDMIRFASIEYPNVESSHFPDPTSQLIDEERREQYLSEDSHFESQYVIALTYQTPIESESRLQNWLVTKGESSINDDNHLLRYFLETVDKIANGLSNYLQLRRLTQSALLTYLHTCLTGLSHSLVMPKIPVYLGSLLATQDFVGGLQLKIGGKFIKSISITGLPLESQPGLLNIFEHMPLSFRWSNRFIFLDPNSANQEISIYRRNWFQKRHGLMGLLREVFNASNGAGFQNRDALEMTGDADDAITLADSALVRFGYYTSVVILMDEDLHHLEEGVKFVLKQLSLRGFTGRIETLNAIEAYLGTLPGHGYENVRKPLIHSLNLTDLIPLTSVWAGLQANPCRYYSENSPPILHAKTIGNTPFRLHLHVNDVAHTLIKGSTGAGKSTLILTIIAQFFRYCNAQVFLFDKGYSSYPLCKAMKGIFYDIGSEQAELSFYPFRNIDEPQELEWASSWVEILMECQGVDITSDIRKEIRASLIRLQQQPINKRTLTDFQGTVQNSLIKDALQYYTLGGALGHILDADKDSLRQERLQVFEMQHLLQQGDVYLKPILLYLFHQIDKQLKYGHPSLIIIEEGHAFLKGQFGQQLETWLLEKRKENTGVIFIDQSLSKIMQSQYAHTVIDSCQTKIFLPDKDADSELNAPLYHAAGLEDREIEIIKHSQPKQHYFYSSSMGKRLIDLALGRVALSFVGVDSANDRSYIDNLESEYGDKWVYYWLLKRGLNKWADRWLEIYEVKYANK